MFASPQQQIQVTLALVKKNELEKAELISMELHSRHPFLPENLYLIANIKQMMGKQEEAFLFAQAGAILAPQSEPLQALFERLNHLHV